MHLAIRSARWRTAAAVLMLGALAASQGLVARAARVDAATLSVAPQAVTGVAVGVTIPFDVNLDASEPISGISATVDFDPAVIQILSLTFDAAWQRASVAPAPSTSAIAIANQTGRLHLGAFLPRGQAVSQARLVSIFFHSVACGATFIGLQEPSVTTWVPGGARTQVPTSVSAGAFSVCTGDPPTPTPSPTASAIANPSDGASSSPSESPSSAAEPTPSPSQPAVDPSLDLTPPPTDAGAARGTTEGPMWLTIVTTLVLTSLLLIGSPRRRARRQG